MKSIFTNLNAILVISVFLSSMASAQEYYSKGQYRLIRSNADVPFVISMDERRMGDIYLPTYTLQRKNNLRYETGMEYNFFRDADTSYVDVYIGLYPSVREAEDAVLDGLNGGGAWMKEGPYKGEYPGDNFWYYLINTQLYGERLISLTFVRYNAVIHISDMGAKVDLLAIAKSIDQDIQNGAEYLKSSKSISPPTIHSVSAPKEIPMNNRIIFTIDASDPEGYSLTYYCLHGGHQFGQPENILGAAAKRDYFPNESASGPHTYRIWVVNENNLFSSVKEVPITF